MFFQLHRNVQLRILTSFLMRMVGFTIFPFMAIYFSDEFGKIASGIILGLTVLVSVMASLYGGYIADRRPRKKVLLIGQLGQVASLVMMTTSVLPQIDSPILMLIGFVGNTLSNGLSNPATEAILVDSCPQEQRRVMYTINYWSINLSIAIGVMLGGLFYQSSKLGLLIALTTVAVFTLILLQRYLIDEFIPKPQKEKTAVLSSYRPVFADRRFVLFLLGSLLVFALEFQLANYIGVRLHESFKTVNVFDFDVTGVRMLSLLQLQNTLLVVGLSLFLPKLLKAIPERRALIGGLLCYVVGFSLFASVNTLSLLLLLGLVQTFGELVYSPIRQTKLADLLVEDKRASYLAVSGFVFQGAKYAGAMGLVIGALIGPFGMTGLLLVCGLLGMFLMDYTLYRFPSPSEENYQKIS
ncbi:MDR family MFS transporter [Exiguobacterium flavidum]|uniref:MDR family MFS transporter n=1 Tax=Exiguobacterium flavidum TaxID=2184695 RepID=UPI000DF77D40|nr:MFS transporter [Exiguobacterium flavidum]